jgi:hypothetical protein
MAYKDKVTGENVSKCLCVILLVLQSCILDYYLVENHSLAWIGFSLVDLVIIILWIAALYIAYKQCRKQTHEVRKAIRTSPDELRVAYVAWLVYAVGYAIQISFIFKTFAHKLDNAQTTTIFGQNMLKLSLTITPMLFLLLVHAHHDAAPNTSRKYYIEKLTGSVTIDLMDSIEILEILFTDVAENNLPTSFENTIIAFACINVFLPTLALHALKQKKIWHGHGGLFPSKVLYHLCYIFLVNVPFFIIRVLLWVCYEQDVSVFLAKNFILIVMNSWDIVEHYSHHKRPSCSASSNDNVALEDIPSGKDETAVNVHDPGENIKIEISSLNGNEDVHLGMGYV